MRKNKGFTLIELTVVLVLAGILALFLSGALNKGIESWYFVADRSDLMAQTPYALNRIARELRYIKDSKSVYAAGASSITFNDASSSSITYNLSGGSIYRNGNPLLDGVTNFSLQYLDANGNIIATPVINPSATNIRKIRISVTVQKGNNPFSMETIVKPRNI